MDITPPTESRDSGYRWLLELSLACFVAIVVSIWYTGAFADTARWVLAGLMVAFIAVYLYDRSRAEQPGHAAPTDHDRRVERFRAITIGALVLFLVSAMLHNVVALFWGIEEPVFFLIAVIVAPLAFLVGAVGALVTAITGVRRPAAPVASQEAGPPLAG